MARPSGCTSTSFAVKSVHGAVEVTYNLARTGPMTSIDAVSGSEEYTSTSVRCSIAC